MAYMAPGVWKNQGANSKVYIDLYSASTRKRLQCVQIWAIQCYLQTTPYLPLFPVAEYHRRLASTHCTYQRRDGQAELT